MGSACWVYAIVGRDTPRPAATAGGVVTELSMVPWRELAAVTGPMAHGGASLTMEHVLSHEAVVEAARRQGPSLPVRFGTVFPDAEAVASALAERYETLTADLGRLGDKVELSVTVLRATPASSDGPTHHAARAAPPLAGRGAGARYLQARAAEMRREDAVRDEARVVARALDQVLGPLAIERMVTLLPTPRIAVRTTWLLDPAGVAAFRTAFEAMRQARGELRFLLTGPWPPYSFVRRTESGGEPASGGRLDALVRLLTDEMQRRHD